MENKLIGAILSNPFNDPSGYYLQEFISLCQVAGFQTSMEFLQKSDKPNSVSYFGIGKLCEIKQYYQNSLQNPDEFLKFDCLLVNDELTNLQKKTIEEVTGLEVYDRTMVILKIFAINAKTKEAKLQVEIATLSYFSNQLVDTGADYAQVTSGSAYNKGEGEKKIDLNKRLIEKQILVKSRELEEIKLSRRTSRSKRNETTIPKVAVVGYTNAGKSTLINALNRYQKVNPLKDVFTKDEVFATLETSTRLIAAYPYPAFFITDTVGFISKLPICLVDAFRSTLEEINESDLLVEVIDCADPEYQNHILTTEQVLKDIGCQDIPIIFLLNKYDQLDKKPTSLPNDDEIYTCLTDEGESVKDALSFISSHLAKNWDKKDIIFPYEGNFHRFQLDNYVVSFKEKDDGYHCLVYLNPKTIYKYKCYF